MKRILLGIILSALLVPSGITKASAEMTAMSLQSRIRKADIVIKGTITKSYDTGIATEAGVQNWKAKCRVIKELKGKVTDTTIQIGFIQIPRQAPQPKLLEEQKTYLLFFKDRGSQAMPRYELITPYHGALEFKKVHWIHDEADPDYPSARQMTGEEIIEKMTKIINNSKEQLLTLTIKSDKEVYEVGEEIWIDVKITNVSDDKIIIPKWPNGIEQTLIDDTGKPEILAIDAVIPDENITLFPKKFIEDRYDLSESHIIKNKLGKLDHNITYDYYFDSKYFPSPWQGTLTSNTITIEVVEKEKIFKIYTVERVINGDTLKLYNGEEVQLIGVKAPEDGKKGQKATEFVKSLGLEGQDVRLEFDVEKRDKYGRLLAYAYIWNCNNCKVDAETWKEHVYFKTSLYLFLNATIIKAGYATPMTIPPNVKYAKLFGELYGEAREQRRGLWNAESEIVRTRIRKIANTLAINEGYDLSEFKEPEIEFDVQEKQWYVFYDQVGVYFPEEGTVGGYPGGHFSVWIDADEKDSYLMRGK